MQGETKPASAVRLFTSQFNSRKCAAADILRALCTPQPHSAIASTATKMSSTISISLMDLIGKRIRVIGSQQNGPEYLYEALDFVAGGKVKTIVETYPLADAPKAYQRVVDGKTRFRAVLTM